MDKLATSLHRLFLLCLLTVLTLPAWGQNAVFGPGLEQAIASLDSGEHLDVVVTFDGDGPLDDATVSAIQSLGITSGFTFRSLPIAGLSATGSQIQALAGLDGVASIWPNLELTYYNHDARQLTGVDRLREDDALRNGRGFPFSGKGVGVVINDSGVDGTHPDLKLGQNLVQNVLGTTNLHAYDTLLPITYVEDQPSTDTNSGHGTHVAGTVGGTGAGSGGLHAGVAPGADLVGYGSGAVLYILDALGGLDYALTNQFRYDIRVVSNSWGSSGDFDPNDPINRASYLLYKRGINVVFAAGNSGPLEDTHNPYAVAPWVISVGASEKDGTLVDFSSRGMDGETGTFRMYDGRTWTYVNRPTVVAPGVDIISACAAGSPLCLLGIQDNPFYTMMSGTSMATPHVAGIVALMLEANPTLSPAEVRSILQETATNMPGNVDWEVGTGLVNAYTAVVNALGLRTDFGETLNFGRDFNASVDLRVERLPISIDYNPEPLLSSTGNRQTFDVSSDVAYMLAHIVADGIVGETGNSIYPVLIAPDGTQYLSGTTLLFPISYDRLQPVSSPVTGRWTLEIRGIQSGTGENLVSFPEQVQGTLFLYHIQGYSGLDDIDGHPAAGAIQSALYARLLDGLPDGTYQPDAAITRAHLAEYLVMGAGVRQFLPIDGSASFGDVDASLAPFAEAVTARGAAIRDRLQRFDGLVRASDGAFRPADGINRAELAYSLVQSLGGQAFAEQLNADFAAGADVVVRYRDQTIVLDDQHDIPADLKGYVQLALELNILNAYFSLEQGPYDTEPTIHATFRPVEAVTRARYAVSAFTTYQHYLAGVTFDTESAEAMISNGALELQEEAAETPERYLLEQNYPNPFNPATQITFHLPESGHVRLSVFDVLGRKVQVLVDGATLDAGIHRVQFDATSLSSGTYIYRLETPQGVLSKQMVLMK